jgi:hypothetical protein
MSEQLLGVVGTRFIVRHWILLAENPLIKKLAKKAAQADSAALELAVTAAFLAANGHADAWDEVAERKHSKCHTGDDDQSKGSLCGIPEDRSATPPSCYLRSLLRHGLVPKTAILPCAKSAPALPSTALDRHGHRRSHHRRSGRFLLTIEKDSPPDRAQRPTVRP